MGYERLQYEEGLAGDKQDEPAVEMQNPSENASTSQLRNQTQMS